MRTRRVEEYRHARRAAREQPDRRARRGELDRQEFRERGMFGLSLGTIGMLLRYVGVEDSTSRLRRRARQGRRHDPRRDHRSSARRWSRISSTRAGARVLGHSGRVPDVHEPAGPRSSRARHELEAERRRDRLDVPAPAGRQVPQRQDPDRAGRRREHEAVRPARARTPVSRRTSTPASPHAGSTPSSSGSSRPSACSRTSSARRPTRRSSSRPRSLPSRVRGSRAG